MGLDQYLHADTYIGGWRHDKPEEVERYKSALALAGWQGWDNPGSPHVTIRTCVAYWRKANQVHRWFVENVQDGVDDCGTYHVSVEQLKELRALCQQELDAYGKGEAGQVLPPTSGFFFGSTEVDEWYRADLDYTAMALTKILDHVSGDGNDPFGVSFYYSSSW